MPRRVALTPITNFKPRNPALGNPKPKLTKGQEREMSMLSQMPNIQKGLKKLEAYHKKQAKENKKQEKKEKKERKKRTARKKM